MRLADQLSRQVKNEQVEDTHEQAPKAEEAVWC